jgi:hypothetical protein
MTPARPDEVARLAFSNFATAAFVVAVFALLLRLLVRAWEISKTDRLRGRKRLAPLTSHSLLLSRPSIRGQSRDKRL